MMRKEITAILIAVTIWASSISVIKVILVEIAPLTLAFIRCAFASLILIVAVLLAKESSQFFRAIRSDWKHLFVLGLIGITVFNSAQIFGVQRTSTALAGILLSTSPLFMVILSVLFLHEVITKNKFLGILVGFIGIILVFIKGQGDVDPFESQAFWGNLSLISAALSWAVYSVHNKKLFEKYSPLHLTAGAYLFGTPMILLFVLAFEDLSDLGSIPATNWLALLYLGVLASGITLLLWNYALNRMDASRASVFLFLIPVIAVLIGWLILDETVTIYTFVGGAFILMGVYLAQRSKTNRARTCVPKTELP